MNLNDIKVSAIGPVIVCAGKRDECFRQWRQIMGLARLMARLHIGGQVQPNKPEKN